MAPFHYHEHAWILFFAPNIDLTLTTECLVELFASINDGKVDEMGDYLETPSSKKEEFKMNYKNPAQRMEAYLDHYVHSYPLASWTEIAAALKYYRLSQQAVMVRNTYIQGMQFAITKLSSS